MYGRGVNKQQNTPLKLLFVPILVVENGPTSKGNESLGEDISNFHEKWGKKYCSVFVEAV